ncbi:MAG: hypothetical protein J6X55_06065 [Victivallales bacterium]|nr:hypothetical protein [Victivallales bacterium]
MADKDFEAELDNLLSTLDDKPSDANAPQEEKNEAPAVESEPAAPAAATALGKAGSPQKKGMLGGGARPLGKGVAKPSGAQTANPAAKSAPAGNANPATQTAVPKPPVAATGAISGGMPSPVAHAVALPEGNASKPSVPMLPMILSGLSLVFSIVAIIMVSQVNGSVRALQTAIMNSSKAQQEKIGEQSKTLKDQIKALNDQTKAIKNIQETLKSQLLERDSEFQKQMRMSRESLDDLLEKLGKK